MVLRMLMMMGSRPRFDSMVQIASGLTLSNAALKSIKNGPSNELISLFQYLAQGKDLIPAPDTLLEAGLVYPGSLRVGRLQTVFDERFKDLQGNGDQADSTVVGAFSFVSIFSFVSMGHHGETVREEGRQYPRLRFFAWGDVDLWNARPLRLSSRCQRLS